MEKDPWHAESDLSEETERDSQEFDVGRPSDREAGGDFSVNIRDSEAAATGVATAQRTAAESGATLPGQPRSLAEVGLSKAFLEDLALKIIHYSGTPSTTQLTQRLGLSPSIVQQLLAALSEDRLCEVLSQSDLYTGNYRYRLSERGEARVAEALERSRYAGPAPVTLEQYGEVMRHQQSHRQAPSRGPIKEALNEITLAAQVSDTVARVIYSGKTALLYGASGNGKSSILQLLIQHVHGVALVPYAVYAYGQVIRVFDPSIHELLEGPEEANVLKEDSKLDRRWVRVKRPAVVLGAELGPESLDITYDPVSRFYQASPHIKAQGGVLVVDDLGRQKMEARELMTRWLIPLERGWDTLTLVTGEKVTVPFHLQLLFATNLPLRELGDDALLRRILYKVHIPSPEPEAFAEILRQLCRQKRVLVADGAIDYVVERLYGEAGIEPRASYARDLVEVVIESSAFDGREPMLNPETFESAFKLVVAERSPKEAAV